MRDCGLARLGGALFFVALAFPCIALAQTSKDVPIDGSVVLERAAQPITIIDPRPALGTLVTATDDRDKTTVLIYVAPATARDGETVKANYSVGNVGKQAAVTIRQAAPTLSDPRFYGASFKAVFVLFILAVLVESGLALIFHWRPYIDNLDSRSANPIVAFLFSFLFVEAFQLDVTQSLVNVYSGTNYPAGTAGSILTALIIAGGSAGVRRILQTFGFRAPAASDEPPRAPPQDQAWVAVTIERRQARGSVAVQIGPPGQVAVAGTITGTGHRTGLLSYLLRDKGRFPTAGGYTVTPGEYEVRVIGFDASGAQISNTWGPAKIANRAIVDLNFVV